MKLLAVCTTTLHITTDQSPHSVSMFAQKVCQDRQVLEVLGQKNLQIRRKSIVLQMQFSSIFQVLSMMINLVL